MTFIYWYKIKSNRYYSIYYSLPLITYNHTLSTQLKLKKHEIVLIQCFIIFIKKLLNKEQYSYFLNINWKYA